MTRVKRNRLIASIAIFSIISIVLDSIPGFPQLVSGVWYTWIFLIEPIAGLVLGPYGGFLSSLIGVMIGHTIYPHGEAAFEFVFSIGAPLGSMVSGFIYSKKLGRVFLYFTILLFLFFITPISSNLPLLGMWDTYLAYLILCGMLFFKKSFTKRFDIGISAFIGLEADILFRIFILIPCQTYRLFYGFTIDVLQIIWIAGALVTPIQVGISIFVTTLIGPRILKMTSNIIVDNRIN